MSRWNGKRVLVTGAGGFIGSHLVEALVRDGAATKGFFHYGVQGGLGNLEHVERSLRDSVEPIFGDIGDAEALQEAMDGIDVVFHLAALVGIPYSYRAPRDVVDTNVVGTLNVLQAARAVGVQRLIHTSTSEVYGTAQTVPMTEEHPLQAQSPYAATKIGADQLVLSFHRSFGLPASVARPFNTYGPRQSMRAIVPTIVGQALSGGQLRLGATAPTRDFNFVTDTVAGFLAIAQTESTIGKTYNIGTGREASVANIVEIVGQLLGKELEIWSDQQRVRPTASEVDRLVADASKIRRDCGWLPSVTLEGGLGQVIEWVAAHRDEYDGYRYAV